MLVEGYLRTDENGKDHFGRCHSFVTDGKIAFGEDCSHALKGKTVDLPDWEDVYEGRLKSFEDGKENPMKQCKVGEMVVYHDSNNTTRNGKVTAVHGSGTATHGPLVNIEVKTPKGPATVSSIPHRDQPGVLAGSNYYCKQGEKAL